MFEAEPMIPFYAAGLIVAYCVNLGANAMMDCKSLQGNMPKNRKEETDAVDTAEEFRNDPRNPNIQSTGAKPANSS